jgi:hypothetical protein
LVNTNFFFGFLRLLNFKKRNFKKPWIFFN